VDVGVVIDALANGVEKLGLRFGGRHDPLLISVDGVGMVVVAVLREVEAELGRRRGRRLRDCEDGGGAEAVVGRVVGLGFDGNGTLHIVYRRPRAVGEDVSRME